MDQNDHITMRECRLALGLTQAQLAEQIGFTSAQQINNIENGRRPASLQTLLAIECLMWRAGLMTKKGL